MLSTLQGPSQTMEEISPFFTIPLDSLSSQNVLQDIVIKNVSDDSIAINNNQKENTTIIFLDDLELLPEQPIPESKEEPKPSTNKRKLKIEASTNISKYKCFKCFEQFYSLNMYRQHMTWHRNIKKYKCLNCSAGYNNENNFKIHMAMHMQGKPKCPICEASFQRLASLKSHLMMHQEEELFNCDDCKAEFDKEDDLIKHMEIHMTNKAKENQPLTCPYCKIDYEDTISYKEHISYHIKVKKLLLKGKRAKKLRPITGSGFSCTKCEKTFTKMSLLDRHERIHSGEKPYVCQYCNRGFTQKGTLQIHLRNHTGLKPFKCTLCPAKFNQKGNLRVHIEKTHTAPSTGQVYKCSACNCIFKKVASLNGHMTKVHNDTSEINSVIQKLKQLDQFSKVPETAVENIDPGIIMKPHNSESYIRLTESWHDGSIRRYSVKRKIVGDVRWYCCQFCSKECKKPSDLIRHIRIHTKEKPFECTLCNASFALKATMLGHIKTHSKQSLLKCNKCDQGFYSKRSLLKHQKKHTAVFNPQYQCSLCRKVFNNFDAANQHRKEHSDQNTDDCIKLVLKQPLFQMQNGPSQTKAPKQKVTNTELQSQRPHHCTICNGRFTRLVNLQRHLKVHENDRSFKCTLCPKAFVSGYKLKEHLKFHSNVREFKCELCNKQFVTSYLLKRHLLTHNDSKPYNCQYCDKNFKTAILARSHILKLHKKKVSLQALEMYHKNGEGNVKCVEPKSDNPPPDTIPNLIIGTEIAEEIAVEPEVEVPPVQENQPQVFEIPNTILSNDLITTDGQELSEDFSQIYQTVYVNCENLEDPNFSTNILSQLEQGSSEELLNNTQNTVVFNIDSIDMQNTEINQILKQNANFPNQENIDIVVHNLNMNPTINFNANEENKVYYYEYDTTTSELKNSFLVTEDNKIAETLDITCTVCDNKFDQMTNFKDHNCVALAPVEKVKEKEEKAKSKPEFQCNICKRKMNSRISYYKHVSSHDRSKLNPNACCICQKVFKKPSDLTRHIRTHTGEKPFACEKCDKKFALKSTLASHMRSHDPENSKKFKCEICNSLFSFKSSLTTHLRIHSGKKPYNCNFCSATFRTPAHKSLHESTNHILKTKKKSKEKITTLLESVASEVVANVEEGMKNNAVLMNQSEQMLGQDSLNMLNITVPDNISDQIQIDPVILLQELQSSGVLIQDGIGDNDMISTSILQLDDLTLLNLKNIGIEENEKPSPEKTRNFECDECHKMYASKDVLRKHKKIHNRVKQFPCTKCSKGFDNEDEWNVHVLTHHNGLRPFTCAFCSNSFARENNLRTHMKRIHDISNI